MSQAFNVLASCRSKETLELIQGAFEGMSGARVELRNGALLNVMNDFASGRRIDVMVLDVDLEDDTELGHAAFMNPSTAPSRPPERAISAFC